jgi:hypothetical protein
VACPYCRQTVTAPATSTYQPDVRTPVATPIPPPVESEVEPGPAGLDPLATPVPHWPAGNACAVWALVLSCLALAVFIATNVIMAVVVIDRIGPSPTPEEQQAAVADLQKEWMEQVQAGKFPPELVAMGLSMIAMFLAWIAGIVLGIVALQRPARRGMAIASLVISAVMPLLMCLGVVLQI